MMILKENVLVYFLDLKQGEWYTEKRFYENNLDGGYRDD